MGWRGGEVQVPTVGADGGVVDAGICAQKKDHVSPRAPKGERPSLSLRRSLEDRAAKLHEDDAHR